MTDRLVLSSSYFNVTGGRRQDSADTFRVLASLQTHSGEQAALYAVSEASTPGPMGARARRLVIDIIQGEYSSRFELPSATRLRTAVERAHEELETEFQGHVRVGLTALVAEGASLYLLQVPPAQAYVRHAGNLHSVSSNPANQTNPFGHALGCQGPPKISVFRDTVEPADVIVLCSTWFAEQLQGDELRAAFSAEDPDEITALLFRRARELKASEATCIALQAGVEEARVSESDDLGSDLSEPRAATTLWEHVDEAVSSLSYVWSKAVEELQAPSRLGTRASGAGAASATLIPDVTTDIPPAEETAGAASAAYPAESPLPAYGREDAPSAAASEALTSSSDIRPDLEQFDQPTAWEPGTEEVPIVSPPDYELPLGSEGYPEGASGEPAAGDARPADRLPSSGDPPFGRDAELEEVNSFIQNTMNLGKVAPPVQGFPDMTVAPERIYPGSPPSKRPRRFAEGRPGRREPVDRTPLLQPRVAGHRTDRARLKLPAVPPAMWLWSGVGVALVVVIIVAYSLISGGHKSASTYYIDRARVHARLAERSKNPVIQGVQFAAARKDLRLARNHGYTHAQIVHIQQLITKAVDVTYRIVPPPKLTAFANLKKTPNASAGPIAAGTSLLFTLSSKSKHINSIDLSNAKQTALDLQPGNVFSIGPPDPWHVPAGLATDGNTLVAVDNRYNLLTDVPGSAKPSTLQLVQPSGSNVVAATTFLSNFYTLDSANGQIWRFPGYSPGSYSQYSSGYLTAASPKLLKRGVSIAIDGAVYVGLRGGTLLKFLNGQQAKFKAHVPFQVHLTQIFTRAGLKHLYVLDRRAGRILVIDKQKGYVDSWQIPPGIRAHGLGGIAVSSNGRTMFLMAGLTIYQIPLS